MLQKVNSVDGQRDRIIINRPNRSLTTTETGPNGTRYANRVPNTQNELINGNTVHLFE
jgi:hypothetical protein